MMFLFAVPVMEGLALYFVPLMIGTRNVAFPNTPVPVSHPEPPLFPSDPDPAVAGREPVAGLAGGPG